MVLRITTIISLFVIQITLFSQSGIARDRLFSQEFIAQETLTQAELIDQAFEKLKDKDIRLSNHGYVCEELAMQYVAKMYDPKTYTLYNGIVYSNNNSVIGEIDIVVTKKSTGKAVMIAEVKCKSRVTAAINKAKKQLKRFTDNIGTESVELYLYTDKEQIFDRENFLNKLEKRYISYKGTTKKGFSDELLLSLASVKALQNKLKCYRSDHDAFCN